MFIIGILIGNHFEEKEIYRVAAKEYKEFSKIIPYGIFPDLTVLFSSGKTIKKLETQIDKSSS